MLRCLAELPDTATGAAKGTGGHTDWAGPDRDTGTWSTYSGM